MRLPFPIDKNKSSIFLIGDSTVRNGAGDGENGEWGWGDLLEQALGNRQYNIVNRAVGGLSSRTFYTGGHFARTLSMMQAGDILLMQFGHNDSSPINDDKRARGTIPGINEAHETIENLVTGREEVVHSYGWYLRQMFGEAKARGIRVVVCSPVPSKIWEGTFIARNENDYPAWAMQVARQSGSDFIDLFALVAKAYERLGKSEVDNLFADEYTHTSREGASLTAGIVAQQLQPLLRL